MKKSFTWKEHLYLIGMVAFLFSCIASTHRTARTLQPGQFSGGAVYSNARSVEDLGGGAYDFLTTDARVGVVKGLDLGMSHTWDLTAENENSLGTLWGDFKVQISNRNNEVGKLIFSTGLAKGYMYNTDDGTHLLNFPFLFSIPASEVITPTFSYQYQVFSEGFIPNGDEFTDGYHHFALGSEFCLINPQKKKWTPKLGISIGYFSSFQEGDDGYMIFNGGIILDSPFKPFNKKEK